MNLTWWAIQAVFLRHEGHAGAIGALLSSVDSDDVLYSPGLGDL